MVKFHLSKLFILFLILLSLISVAKSQVKQLRNLEGYAVGPTFEDFDSRFGEKEAALNRDRGTYLWDVWSHKKQAYFVENAYTIEGARIPCTYYVEKNKTGSWQVAQECDRISVCPYTSKAKCEVYRYDRVIYDRIEKVYSRDGKFILHFHLKKKPSNFSYMRKK